MALDAPASQEVGEWVGRFEVRLVADLRGAGPDELAAALGKAIPARGHGRMRRSGSPDDANAISSAPAVQITPVSDT
jgi:hypothetical protein